MLLIYDDLFESYFSSQFFSTDVLTHRERSLTKRFNIKRSLDFSTGRFCAKKALLSLGINNADILIGDNNEPLWPQNITGSISHSNHLVGAITSSKDKVISIGIDIETIGKVGPDVWNLVFTTAEQNFISALEKHQQELYSTLLFSAKECFYKLQFPLTKQYIDFKEVEITIKNNYINLSFVEKFHKNLEFLVSNLVIKYCLYKNDVITYSYIPA
jgi:4'-phosphopantetheinyl transferase EntD